VEAIEKQLKEIEKALDAKMEKAIEEAKNASDDAQKKVHEETKNEIANLSQKYNELTAEKEGTIAKMQEQLDANELELKGIKEKGTSNSPSLKSFIEKGLNEFQENLEAFKASKGEGFTLDLKAVGDMSSSGNLTGEVVAPERVPGIVSQPERSERVRDVLATGTTVSDTIRYIEETGTEGGPANVAEGAQKPQLDFDYEAKDAPVRKIATYLKVPEEMIADIPWLASTLSTRGVDKLKNVEDTQLLFGDGTGNNLTGLTVGASDYTDELADSNVNRFDVLRSAIKQIRVNEYKATAILLHPDDVFNMDITKDSQGRYLLPNIFTGNTQGVKGVPIIESTFITADNFLVGDFQRGAMLFDRMQANVRFYEQDEDNAQKNMVTIVIEERLGLPIYRPSAFLHGTFAAALANGTA